MKPLFLLAVLVLSHSALAYELSPEQKAKVDALFAPGEPLAVCRADPVCWEGVRRWLREQIEQLRDEKAVPAVLHSLLAGGARDLLARVS